jgi:hypothetical protein
VPKRVRKSRLVRDAIPHASWIQDISGSLSGQALREYVHLWVSIQSGHLQEGTPDRFLSRWTSDQRYSTSSAYHAFFVGQSGIPGTSVLRKARAPPTCKFFLTLLDRCWTSERLQRHNLQNNGSCALRSQEIKTISHLLLQYSFSREIWFRTLRFQGFQALAPSAVAVLQNCWPESRKAIPKPLRRWGFKLLARGDVGY